MSVQVFGSLSPTWGIWIEFPAPGFSLSQPLLHANIWRLNQQTDDSQSLPLSLCYSTLAINKFKKKKKKKKAGCMGPTCGIED